jgi:hypothetical protein
MASRDVDDLNLHEKLAVTGPLQHPESEVPIQSH